MLGALQARMYAIPEMMQQIPEVMRAPILRLIWPTMMKNTTPTIPAREFMFMIMPFSTPRR